MKFSQDTSGHIYTIHAYAVDTVTVSLPAGGGGDANPGTELELEGSFIIAPQHLLSDWAPANFEALSGEHFAPVLELEPELVLLGTGTRLRFPPAERLQPLLERGIGCEVMDTGAACRTYNILAGEGRQVVAALLLG